MQGPVRTMTEIAGFLYAAGLEGQQSIVKDECLIR